MRFRWIILLVIAAVAVSGCAPVQQEAAVEFKGKIAKSYADSEEWWPEPEVPPEGAPNVIIFLLDDVGFAQVGPFDRWPSGEGFDPAYTFMAADVHQFIPVMWNDNTPEPYRKTYNLDRELADRAINWITGHKSIKPDLPFMMLWASGSMHSPHHAPAEYLERYRGKFEMGWDKAQGLRSLGFFDPVYSSHLAPFSDTDPAAVPADVN